MTEKKSEIRKGEHKVRPYELERENSGTGCTDRV